MIGDESFMYVSEFNLTEFSELESVEIGMNSFTKKKDSYSQDANRHFYLKNCPKLRSLRMGRYSFSDYTVIEIENVDALEEIEIGDLHEGSYNFYSASLELKSVAVATQSPLDLPQLKTLIFGDGSFGSCHHLVFKSNTISVSSSNRPARTAIQMGRSACQFYRCKPGSYVVLRSYFQSPKSFNRPPEAHFTLHAPIGRLLPRGEENHS